MSDSNWIDSVLEEVQHVETPRMWLWWSLVTAISAVSANYYLRTLKGAVLYKPNLYVMLLGESGLGKGFGVNLAKLLVQKADTTRVIAGRSSIQAIVSELSKQKSRPDGKEPITDSRGFVVNGELSSAVIADVDALSILTDLYDGHYNPEWSNLLKTSGKETLKQPYVVTLFGSSLAHFNDSIPEANIAGGYVARNLLIYEEKRFQNVDLLDGSDATTKEDLIHDYLVPKYSKHLALIGNNSGAITYSPNAGKLFNSWRTQWRESQVKEKTGFFNRVPDHVLKTAMCLVLARNEFDPEQLMITESEIATAIDKVTGLIYANKIAGQVTKSSDPTVNYTKIVLDMLIRAENNSLNRKLLASRCYPFGLCDMQTLDKILDSLYEMGWIDKQKINTKTGWDYKISLAGEPLNEYNRWKEKQ